MIRTEKIEYQDSELTYEGVVSYDDEIKGKLPAIMIAHAGIGFHYNRSKDDK